VVLPRIIDQGNQKKITWCWDSNQQPHTHGPDPQDITWLEDQPMRGSIITCQLTTLKNKKNKRGHWTKLIILVHRSVSSNPDLDSLYFSFSVYLYSKEQVAERSTDEGFDHWLSIKMKKLITNIRQNWKSWSAGSVGSNPYPDYFFYWLPRSINLSNTAETQNCNLFLNR
jgi:hypothetical protein